MTENLISPHGLGDMWHVTGPGESWFYDDQGHQFFLNFRDKTVYLTLRATGRVLPPSDDTRMSSAEAAAWTIKWHQVREAVLGAPSESSGEKISKISGAEGPMVDRRKAERALQRLEAELLQHDQRRDEDEVKIADAVRQVTQLNQQLDALARDLDRMKTFSRESNRVRSRAV